MYLLQAPGLHWIRPDTARQIDIIAQATSHRGLTKFSRTKTLETISRETAQALAHQYRAIIGPPESYPVISPEEAFRYAELTGEARKLLEESTNRYTSRRVVFTCNVVNDFFDAEHLRGSRILEIGPGQYSFALIARGLGAEVIIVDLFEQFLAPGRALGFDVIDQDMFDLDPQDVGGPVDGLWMKGIFTAMQGADYETRIRNLAARLDKLVAEDAWAWLGPHNCIEQSPVLPGKTQAESAAFLVEFQRQILEQHGWKTYELTDDDRFAWAMNTLAFDCAKYVFTKNLKHPKPSARPRPSQAVRSPAKPSARSGTVPVRVWQTGGPRELYEAFLEDEAALAPSSVPPRDIDSYAPAFAWQYSYVLEAWLQMYRATGDESYLDRTGSALESILATRDDRRGAADYSGQARKAWSLAGRYTIASGTVHERGGNPVLEFCAHVTAYGNETQVEIRPSGPGRWDVLFRNPRQGDETFTDLSFDRSSPRFIERIINARQRVALDEETKVQFSGEGGSKYVTVRLAAGATASHIDLREMDASTNCATIPLMAPRLACHTLSGSILSPALQLARIIQSGPALAHRRDEMERFVAEATEVMKDAESEWRSGPDPSQGHYLFAGYGAPFWADGTCMPFDYLLAAGRATFQLWELTAEQHWLLKAQSIGNLFRTNLTRMDNGSVIWPWWWGKGYEGWKREDRISFNTPQYGGSRAVANVLQSQIAAGFAATGASAGHLFDDHEMKRLCRTFLLNIDQGIRSNRLNHNIDGTDRPADQSMNLGHWADLVPWDHNIWQRSHAIISQARKDGTARNRIALYAMATLLRWAAEYPAITER